MDLNIFDANELLALAKIDLNAGNVAEALAKSKQAINKDDAPNELNAFIARIYAQLRLFDKATAGFEAFLAKEPEAVLEIFQMGMVYFDSGQLNKAHEIWSGVLERVPTYPPALYYSALIKVQKKQEDEAKRDIEVLMKSAPVDNLYFEKAKELLAAIGDASGETTITSITPQAKDIYKNEH